MARTQIPGEPTGAHWGEYASTSELPNVSGAAVQTDHLNNGDLATVDAELYVCISPGQQAATWSEMLHATSTVNFAAIGSLTASTTVTAGTGITSTTGNIVATAGDLAAVGGFRQVIGPFVAPGAAGVTAASQTNLDLRYSHVSAFAGGYVATRAGSIMGISGNIDTAITGAGTTITLSAVVDGTEVALTAALTEAGAETSITNTAAKDALAFSAGAVLGISYTSTAITNTPALVASLEIES